MKQFRVKLWSLIFFLFVPIIGWSKVFLVSVGISNYPGTVNDLRLPVMDAKKIVQVYRENTEMDYCVLLDSMATNSNIKKAMVNVFNKAKENDVVVFFYSGHGYSNGLFVYNGVLDYREIRKGMASSKSKNKMIFVDACFSGKLSVEDRYPAELSAQSKRSNVMLFLSSRSNETSYEGSDVKNSYFTTFLSKGLRGAADANHDCKITALELFRYVHLNVAKFTDQKQHPIMWGNFPNDMPVLYRLLEK